MKVVYKKWEDGQGLEELQAQIYTGASGLPANGWQIKERNIQRGPDLTRYALTEDGKPLAYVTSNISTSERGRALIGYPWSLPDCPSEAKNKIFSEQFSYLKNRDDIEEITTAVVIRSKIKDEQIAFFKEKGFVEDERIYRYSLDFDVVEAANQKVEGKASKLTSRVATEKDIDLLIELCLADEGLREAFSSKDGFRSYFRDRVFKVRPPVMLFDGDQIVAASAPLRFEAEGSTVIADGERIIMRFTAIRPGYSYAWNRLLVELAKECKAAGWTDIPIYTSFGFSTSGAAPSGIAKLRPELEEFEIILKSKKE